MNTPDVTGLIERLNAGHAETPGHVVVWVENLQAYISDGMFSHSPEWRAIFREELDKLLAAASEGAAALQSLSLELERVTSERDDARDYGMKIRIREKETEDARVSAVTRATAAEAESARLGGALEPFAKLGSIILAEAPADAKTIVVFRSTSGMRFSMRLDYFRAAVTARRARPDMEGGKP